MLGRTAIILVAGALFLAIASQAAYADQYIPLDQHFTMNGKNIEVYLIQMNIADEPLSNINYDIDPKSVYWVRLVYQYDNFGGDRDEAFITPILIDSHGNEYRYKSNEPTTVWVKPHFRTGSLFVEIPVPKNVVLTELVCEDGTVDHSFKLPIAELTPITSATPVPQGPTGGKGTSWHDCIPLIPFGMAGGIAAAGIVINRSGIIKR